MNETEQLIRQAARELGIDNIRISDIDNVGQNMALLAEFTRKDGSEGSVRFIPGIDYLNIIERLKAEYKSAVAAAAAKAKRIAKLEAELKELKGE